MMNNKWIKVFIITAVMLVLLVIILKCSKICMSGVENDTLILAFFGILTTMIVLGNFTQVENIEQRTISELNKFRTEQIYNIQNQMVSAIFQDVRIQKILDIDKKLESLKSLYVKLASEELSNFVMRVLEKTSIECTINNGEDVPAVAVYRDRHILFFKQDGTLLTGIKNINNMVYNERIVDQIIDSYLSV